MPPDDPDVSDEAHWEPSARNGSDAAGYALESKGPAPPPLAGEVVVAQTADELIDRVAADMVAHGMNCVRQFGDFHLALPGGETLDKMYQRLMFDPNYRALPWRRTHLWQIVEAGDRYDFRHVEETIIDHADIPPEQVHRMSLDGATGDRDYEREIRDVLAWREKGHDRLDYVLLVMNGDGTIGGIEVDVPSDDRLVRFSSGREADSMALTPLLIRSARVVAIYAIDEQCADTVARLARGGDEANIVPATRLSPIDGELKWYRDAAACGEKGRATSD